MNEFLEQFAIESRELVAQATEGLLRLELSPQDAECLDGVFRAFHTLKGGAGIVEFIAMERAVHAAEDVLAAVRSGRRVMTTALVGDCLATLDQVGRWLDGLASTGELPPLGEGELDALTRRFAVADGRQDAPPLADRERDWVAALLSRHEGHPGVTTAVCYVPGPDCFFEDEDPLVRIGTLPKLCSVEVSPVNPWPKLSELDPYTCNLTVTALTASSVDAVRAHMHGHSGECEIVDLSVAGSADLSVAGSAAVAPVGSAHENRISPRTIRVDAERIDDLVRLTGELTTAKNALGHTARRAENGTLGLAAPLKEQFEALERLVGELQRSVLALRVLPLRAVLQRFPRVMRDLSSSLSKPATLQIGGDHTEADKAIVEMLFEPLLHTLRNAIDHGVEESHTRLALGKPLVAAIHIRAGRDGDRVVIEVEDDGAGVDVDRVRRVALDRKIATADALRAMTDEEIIDLIFAPGFSTAATVSELSGRGVGLDAVRSAIERVGGTVAMHSRRHQGSCVRFSLPFSVMITEVMTVEAGGQMFGIPVDVLVETLRVPAERLSHVGLARVLVHRAGTIPVIDLTRELAAAPAPALGSCDALMVLASVLDEVVALQVERLGERIEIILKPLEGLLAGTRGIAGTALLGDGRVLLVLDLKELLRGHPLT